MGRCFLHSVANRDTPDGRGQHGDSKRNFGRTGRKSISRKAYNKASAVGKRPKKELAPEKAPATPPPVPALSTQIAAPPTKAVAGQRKITSRHMPQWMVCCFRYGSGDT